MNLRLLRLTPILGAVLSHAALLPAAIIGTNIPAKPLTVERIGSLPPARQPAWRKYLDRSSRQMQTDQAYLASELRQHKFRKAITPPQGNDVRSIPLNRPAEWYGQADGLRIADIILSFQTPAGGWSKNLDMSAHRRAPGEHFAPGNASRHVSQGDFDEPLNENWHYVGTFDNDATITQLRYLAKVIVALKSSAVQPYRKAFLHGLDYIFAAQYPNGGWPQVWPLEGGYHDAITFNDDAMINVLRLLREVAEGKEDFAFVPAKAHKLADASVRRGIECILAAQIVVEVEKTDGGRAGRALELGRIGPSGRVERRTVWCQQHDSLTLEPASARNYEMPSLASAESAQIAMFLMELPNPDRETAAAIRAAAAWFDKTKIHDVAFGFTAGEGRRLVSAPGNGPLWSRYCEIGSDRPIFGDRDKTIHDTVDEISQERRNGYGWYRDTPQRALERYAAWEKEHPKIRM